ncbi:MAG TPA: CDP-alcohol phosphatidyltransferase family protein [Nitrososphaera sp.]
MLNGLRDSLELSLARVGRASTSIGLSANFWTGMGLGISILAGLSYASNFFPLAEWSPWSFSGVVGGILLLISGFCDVIDGSVARVSNQITKRGAFLDSSFDKIAEIIVFAGIAYGGLADPFLCLVSLGMSLLVSYTRARAESLGIKLRGVGIAERAERILLIAVIGMIPIRGAMDWALLVVSVLAGITSVHRIVVTARKLSTTT